MNKKYFSIGTTYEGHDSDFLKAINPHVSHIEFSTDSILHQNSFETYTMKQAIDDLLAIADGTDILVHGSGLSVGSYDGYSQSYIKLLGELFYHLSVKSHSERLAYTMVSDENSGAMLTLPKTDESLEIICQRIDFIQKKFKIPFLLQNAATLLPVAECKYSDAAFFNRITELTGCGLILDLYNLGHDAYNFNLNVSHFMEELNADSIYEVHLTGALTESNFQIDRYSNFPAPENAMQMLQSLLSKAPKNLTALTYDVNELAAPAATTNTINKLVMLDQLLNKPNDPFNTIANQFVIPDQLMVN